MSGRSGFSVLPAAAGRPVAGSSRNSYTARSVSTVTRSGPLQAAVPTGRRPVPLPNPPRSHPRTVGPDPVSTVTNQTESGPAGLSSTTRTRSPLPGAGRRCTRGWVPARAVESRP